MTAERTDRVVVAFGLCLAFLAAFQMFKLPPVLPVLLESYRYDRTLAGGFMSVYALAGLIFSLWFARLLERHGIAGPVLAALGLMLLGVGANAKEVVPMLGGVIIDGYDFGKDIGPKGSIAFDESKGEFVGYYNALKMPAGRRAIFAWVHDTENQKSEYLGPVGWLKKDTGGKNKGNFRIPVPAKFKNGNFGSYEIIGFSSEKT